MYIGKSVERTFALRRFYHTKMVLPYFGRFSKVTLFIVETCNFLKTSKKVANSRIIVFSNVFTIFTLNRRNVIFKVQSVFKGRPKYGNTPQSSIGMNVRETARILNLIG